MTKKIYGATLLALLASTGISYAAPQSYYGKTLKVSWTEARNQRVQGEGAFTQQAVPMSFTVYVSSKGQFSGA